MQKHLITSLCSSTTLALISSICVWGCAHTKLANNRNLPDKGPIAFTREFAPSEGLVKGPEAEARKEICLNGKWSFQPIYGPYNQTRTTPYGIEAEDLAPDLPNPSENGWEEARMKIPSLWNSHEEFPSHPEKWGQAQMGWVRKTFTVPSDWNNKRLVLRFQAVSGDCKIVLNGKEIGGNFDSALPFSFDITDRIKKGTDNEIMVGIRSHAFLDKQGAYGSLTYPPGGRGLGIWQDVYLLALPKVYISDVYIKPEIFENRLSAQITVQNTTDDTQSANVGADIREWVNETGSDVVSAPEIKWKLGNKALELTALDISVPAHQKSVITLQAKVNNRLKYWDFKSPNLYGMTVSLLNENQCLDKKYERFGWREFRINGRDLLLNGKKIQLLGDSQHLQNMTYMTRRFAWSWFKLLKDVGANSARFHAMVYPEYFHDMADEMGIAVLPESSIYASSCNINYDSPLFWKAAKYNVAGMVKKYRNHPSVYGWSIENEVLPALNVKCKDPVYKKMVYDGMNDLATLCREFDQTRNWISGDGSRDMDGRLPVYNEHYGSTDTYLKESSETDKPYGIGEACIAYYASPRQSEMYVGDRAYRSYKDHSDAIAVDAYELLKVERRVATYCSIWNLGFYGVENLPLGMADISRAPTREDGIFFTKPYVEGKPGIQLERIPPYATQYNPGYNPQLPLYKPLPLFYAVKAAYQPVPQPCEWDHRQSFTNPAAPVIRNPLKEVLFCGGEGSDSFFKLKSIGIPVVMGSSTAKMLLIDCDSVVVDETLIAKIKKAVKGGSTCLFWGLSLENQQKLTPILPFSVEIFARPATSLVPNEKDNRVSSISYKDLYFTENTDSRAIMKYALKGTLVEKGSVLLKACPVDWTAGNNGGMMRSEREKPAGPCFIEVKDGSGIYLLSTINIEVVSPAHIRMISQLFKNLGVEVNQVQVKRGNLFDQTSVLTRTLVAGSYKADSIEEALQKDFISGETTLQPAYEMDSNGCTWSLEQAKNGLFNFKRMKLKNPAKKYGVTYLSFWLQSPKPMNEIMADPNVPEVNFKFSSGGACKIWLNGQEKFASAQSADSAQLEKLPLIKGWNHFLVKVVDSADNWSFTGRLISKDFALLSSMKSALNPYSEKANFYTISHTDPEILYDQAWGLEGDGWYQSFTSGSKAKFKFYGTGVSLTGRVGPDGGKAKLYIDDKFDQVIDYKRELSDPHTRLFSKQGFRNGEHEVVIEVIQGRVAVGPFDQWESFK